MQNGKVGVAAGYPGAYAMRRQRFRLPEGGRIDRDSELAFIGMSS